MANAAARLANLQLNAGGGAQGTPSPGANQRSFAPGYGAVGGEAGGVTGSSHLTAAPVSAAASMSQGPQITSPAAAAAPMSQGYQPPPIQAQQRTSGTFAPGYGPPAPAGPSVGAQQTGHPPMDLSPGQQPYAQNYPSTSAPYAQPAQQQPPPLPAPQQQRLVLPPMLGPLLQFVNVELERALWQGSVLILTNETLLPRGARPPPAQNAAPGGGPGSTGSGGAYSASGSAMHAGPTPATGVNAHVPVVEVWDDGVHGPGTGKPKTFQAKAIYTEPTYKYTFWRADLALPLPQESEVDVVYQIYWGADESAVQSPSARPSYSFRLAAQASQWRMCVTSDVQFSRRVPEAARVSLRGSGPVFRDLIAKHKANPFHVWIGTGGQFNGEGVWDDCEHALRPFLIPGMDNLRRSHVVWTADMSAAVERWYFLEYLRQWFGVGGLSPMEADGQTCFRQAVESIPYSFTPDSEIFPGFGSHISILQSSPVFGGIKNIGSKYYALFQAHTTPTLAHNEHGFLAEGYHSIKRFGPYTALLTLDTRTERQISGIVDRHSYDMLFSELEARVPSTTTNLIVLASNPIIFPRTKNFESLLRSASNSGITSIISYAVNGKQTRNDWITKDRFGESLAVTKLNDFWTAAAHKSERLFLVHSLQEFARRRSCRVTFASGHVNCLSAAHFRTYNDSKYDPRKYPEQRGFVSDFRSMIQLTVSGLVQEPADGLTLRAYHFAGKSAPFDMYTEEKLYHTFNVDVNHLPPPNNNQKLLGRRSYGILIEHDFDNDRQRPGLLSFFYVENETCTGTATPYIINIPPLRYPHLPLQSPTDGRPPQIRPSVTYRGYTANAQSPFSAPDMASSPTAVASGGAVSAHDTKGGQDQHATADPYTYDVPGYENQVTAGGAGSNGSPGSAGQRQQQAPPPYSPAAQAVINNMPPRTEGTYSSSYEHTAAWVQGNCSHTTESDTGGPSRPAQTQQQNYVTQPLSAHQHPAYSQPPYSQPVGQVQQQPQQQQQYPPPPMSASSHPTPQHPQQQYQPPPP
ncbi:hypothetical protein COEREDRAFT_79365 [Coemansia reversa NRRL 1564]|uniref:PhoD-like phosphatase domain-containing protein n=1 Tax=Coemansia reversa (strain ATCC 12441 / NRRL 1564) TaxID=763665 RepID=A0A2G5BIG8_COERN|nr:hypothetical protein COEREDRAFT_79365 [Coemansia reversa NRRL 1564]|eukprot:PIA18793.1 hypothetical protein COEREDRAFT_79365 [Coemansia reversa NRRL 1564]